MLLGAPNKLRNTERSDSPTHRRIHVTLARSLVPLAAQKGQFFCQGNMHLANSVRGCHAVFCSLSTLHTVCRTLCYSLSKSLKHTWAFCVTAEKKNSALDNQKTKKWNKKMYSKFGAFGGRSPALPWAQSEIIRKETSLSLLTAKQTH